MKQLKNIALLLLTLAALISCKSDRLPDGILNEEQMVAFLTDAHLLESYYSITTNFHYEERADEIAASYDELFEKHHTTRAIVDSSRSYYLHHPDLYNDIYEQVLDNIVEKANELPKD